MTWGCDRLNGKAEVEEAVAQQLIDPTSPLFRGTARCYKDRNVWKGEVNGKNRFGAYVGFEPFIYADGETAVGYEDYNFQRLFDRCYGAATAETTSAPEPITAPLKPTAAEESDVPFEDFPPPSEYSSGDEFNEGQPGSSEPAPADRPPPKPAEGSSPGPDPNNPAILGFVTRKFLLA